MVLGPHGSGWGRRHHWKFRFGCIEEVLAAPRGFVTPKAATPTPLVLGHRNRLLGQDAHGSGDTRRDDRCSWRNWRRRCGFSGRLHSPGLLPAEIGLPQDFSHLVGGLVEVLGQLRQRRHPRILHRLVELHAGHVLLEVRPVQLPGCYLLSGLTGD